MASPFRSERYYELTIGDMLIVPPINVAFSADKSIEGGIGKLNVTVYNLNKSHRMQLEKDAEDQKYIPLQFKAGFIGQINTFFIGNVHTGRNYRNGADIITELECLDGGFDYLNSFTAKTVTTSEEALTALLDDMPHIERGKIKPLKDIIRPKVMLGPSVELLDSFLNEGDNWFIDGERLHILAENETVSETAPVISPQTGLLETPEREQTLVTVKTLFNPAILIGGPFELRSEIAPYMNGLYKVKTLNASGEYDGSTWEMTVTGRPI